MLNSSNLRKEQAWLSTGSLVVLAMIALAGVLYYASSVVIPFILAFFIYSLFAPVVDLLVIRLRLPRFFAVLIALLLVLVIIAGIAMLVTNAVYAISSTIGSYSNSLGTLSAKITQQLEDWHINIERASITTDLAKRLPGIVTTTFGTAVSISSTILLIAIFVIFMLAGRRPNAPRPPFYKTMDSQIRRYIAVKIALSLVTGILVWISLAILRLELASVFGILAFLLNFIPSIGSIIATLLPIPLAVAQFSSPWSIVGVILIPGTIQMVIGNGLEPKILGQGLKLHPVTVLLALAFWGLLWGPVGMILAVPITAIVRIVLSHFDTLRPLADLLAGKLPDIKEEK
ncbi:MAG: AI-2E family transporter [Sedimentisphaerales bacterium]|nr:AI-2E family transporter [Sedimentisphaerales bacterium]